jgi:hypothetical protein
MHIIKLYFIAKQYDDEKDPVPIIGPCLSYEEAKSARNIWESKNYTGAKVVILHTEILLKENGE